MIGDASGFAERLVAWQRVHGRHRLPWQASRDPYRVWLSEIMLQQTQVAAVIPYYRRFVERFPDVRALAAASHDDVMQSWSGLGYYSRARNLHRAARQVVEGHGGSFPDTAEGLETLPGVGRSTAAAIAVFAFGRRAAILDGNVKRVLARFFARDTPERDGWRLAESLVPHEGIDAYTQGLMDLGATICTPKSPKCMLCPLESECLARLEGRVAEFPRRIVRKPRPERRTTLLFVTRADRVWLERRPPRGIWGGLWSLPEAADDDRDSLLQAAGRFGAVEAFDTGPGFTHGFTHFTLHATVARARVAATAEGLVQASDASMRWVGCDESASLGMPAPIRTLVDGWAGSR